MGRACEIHLSHSEPLEVPILENRDGLSQQIQENSVLDWLSIHLSRMYHALSYSLNE